MRGTGSTRFERPGDHLDRAGGDIAMIEIAELAAARIRRLRVLGGLINEYEGAVRPPSASREVSAGKA
jgi:hypothetical protein